MKVFPVHADTMTAMSILDELRAEGIQVVGTDEAGRGPLAGPVVAAAVFLTQEQEIQLLKLGLRDSKRMTSRARERLFAVMNEIGVVWRAQAGSVELIDKINILRAALWAMGQSVERVIKNINLSHNSTCCVVVDGKISIPIEDEAIKAKLVQWPLVIADTMIPAVSAASVVAKVLRDRVMVALDKIYPEYGFARHKGYPTVMHREILSRIGASPVHRKKFVRNVQNKTQIFLNFS